MIFFLVVFSVWLFWIKLPWTFLHKSVGGRVHSFLLGIYVGVELLGDKFYVYLTLVVTAKQFSKVIVLIYTPTRNVWEFQSLHILISICSFQFLIIPFSAVVFIVSFIVVLISVSLSFACWLFGYPLCLLLICKLDCLSFCVGVLDVFWIWFLSSICIENIFSVYLVFLLFLINKIQYSSLLFYS